MTTRGNDNIKQNTRQYYRKTIKANCKQYCRKTIMAIYRLAAAGGTRHWLIDASML
jgi:hypothetical protein